MELFAAIIFFIHPNIDNGFCILSGVQQARCVEDRTAKFLRYKLLQVAFDSWRTA